MHCSIYAEAQDYSEKAEMTDQTLMEKIYNCFYRRLINQVSSSSFAIFLILISQAQICSMMLLKESPYQISYSYPAFFLSMLNIITINEYFVNFPAVDYLIISIIILFAIIYLIGIVFKFNEYIQDKTDAALALLGRISYCIFLIPVIDLLLKSFRCSGGYLIIDYSLICYSASHTVIIVFSCIGLASLLVMMFLISTLQQDYDWKSKDTFSRMTTYNEALILLLKIAIAIIYEFYQFDYYTLIPLLIYGIIILYNSMQEGMIFNSTVYSVSLGCNFCFVWTTFSLIIFHFLFWLNIRVNSSYAFILLGYPLLIYMSSLIIKSRRESYLHKFEIKRESNESDYLMNVFILSRALEANSTFLNELLVTVILDHDWKCQNMKCKCKSSKIVSFPLSGEKIDLRLSESDNEIRIKYILLEYFIQNIEQPNRSAKSSIYYSMFNQHIIGNLPKAYLIISTVKEASFVEKFVLFASRNRIEKNYDLKLKSQIQNKNPNFVDTTKLLRLEYGTRMLEDNILKATEDLKMFWVFMGKPIPDFNSAKPFVYKFIQDVKKTKKTWKIICTVSHYFHPSRFIYSQFLSLTNQTPLKIEDNLFNDSNFNTTFDICNNLINTKDFFSMIISANKSDYGEIKRVSNSCLEITEYQKKDLELHSVDILIKYQFQKVLTLFTKDFDFQSFNSNSILFLKKKSGFIEGMESKFNYLLNIVDGAQIIVMMKHSLINDEFLLYDQNLRIIGISQKLAEILSLSSKRLESIYLKISYLCPDFHELLLAEDIFPIKLYTYPQISQTIEKYYLNVKKAYETSNHHEELQFDNLILHEIQQSNKDLKTFQSNCQFRLDKIDNKHSLMILMFLNTNNMIHVKSKIFEQKNLDQQSFKLSNIIQSIDKFNELNVLKRNVQSDFYENNKNSMKKLPLNLKNLDSKKSLFLKNIELKTSQKKLNIYPKNEEEMNAEETKEIAKDNNIMKLKLDKIDDDATTPGSAKPFMNPSKIFDQMNETKNISDLENKTKKPNPIDDPKDEKIQENNGQIFYLSKNINIPKEYANYIYNLKLKFNTLKSPYSDTLHKISIVFLVCIIGILVSMLSYEYYIDYIFSMISPLYYYFPQEIAFVPIMVTLSVKYMQLLPLNPPNNIIYLNEATLNSKYNFAKMFKSVKTIKNFSTWLYYHQTQYQAKAQSYFDFVGMQLKILPQDRRDTFHPNDIVTIYMNNSPSILTSSLNAIKKFTFYDSQFTLDTTYTFAKNASLYYMIDNCFNSMFISIYERYDFAIDYLKYYIKNSLCNLIILYGIFGFIIILYLFIILPPQIKTIKYEDQIMRIYCRYSLYNSENIHNEINQCVNIINRNSKAASSFGSQNQAVNLDTTQINDDVSSLAETEKANMDTITKDVDKYIKIDKKILFKMILIFIIIIPIFIFLIVQNIYTRMILYRFRAISDEFYTTNQVYTLSSLMYSVTNVVITFNHTFKIFNKSPQDAMKYISKQFNDTFFNARNLHEEDRPYLNDSYNILIEGMNYGNACDYMADIVNCSTMMNGIVKKGFLEVLIEYKNQVFNYFNKINALAPIDRTNAAIQAVLNDPDFNQIYFVERNIIRKWINSLSNQLKIDLPSVFDNLLLFLIIKYISFIILTLGISITFVQLNFRECKKSIYYILKFAKFLRLNKEQTNNQSKKENE